MDLLPITQNTKNEVFHEHDKGHSLPQNYFKNCLTREGESIQGFCCTISAHTLKANSPAVLLLTNIAER